MVSNKTLPLTPSIHTVSSDSTQLVVLVWLDNIINMFIYVKIQSMVDACKISYKMRLKIYRHLSFAGCGGWNISQLTLDKRRGTSQG